MTQQMETHEGPDAFLTPKFYDEARLLGGFAIEHDPDEIAGMAAFLTSEIGRPVLTTPVDQIDFAYYLNVNSKRWWTWDTHYVDAKPDFRYMHGDRILPDRTPPAEDNSTAKAAIAARGTTVVEIQARDLKQPLSLALARTFLIPAHGSEQTRFIAPPDAWVRQARDEIHTAATHEGPRSEFGGVDDPRLQAAAAQRFPRATILRARQ